MKFGVYIAPTEDPQLFAAMAARAEELGFDSVYLPEHTHVPSAPDQIAPGGDALPHDTFKGGDPFIHLAAAAVSTSEILLGTGACLITERDPIVTAKVIASVDRLSGGRLVLGLGAGWNSAELANHGVASENRWDVYREKILAMKALWDDDVASFQGDHVRFGPLTQHPKPAQVPHPPIWVSANGQGAVRRVVEYADGWQPILLPGARPFDVAERVTLLRVLSAEAQRPHLPITLFAFTSTPEPGEIEAFEAAGVDRVVYRVVATDGVPEDMRAYADVAAGFTRS
jgi:probable F420-dependent oxidoreductase